MRAEGWYCDPYGIHSDRWFSDGQPTDLVRDGRVESHDEPPAREPPLPLLPVAEIQVTDGGDLLRADVPKKEWHNPVDGSGAMGMGFN